MTSSTMLAELQPVTELAPVALKPRPKKRKRKQRKPLSGWPFLIVLFLTVLPLGMMLACLLEPIMPKWQVSLWHVGALFFGGLGAAVAIEFLWKTDQ